MVLLAAFQPALLEAQFGAATVEQLTEESALGLRGKKAGFVEKVVLHVPRAVTDPAEFLAANPALQQVWPGFTPRLASAKVSPLHNALYRRKLAYLKQGGSLDNHNYLDCATILNIPAGPAGTRIFLLQADMDVVTDGSDPVRAPELADYDEARGSDWFLPQTAYRWSHPGALSKPLLDYYPAAIARLDHYRGLFLQERAADKGRIWRLLIAAIDSQKARMKTEGLSPDTIAGLKNSRSLLATRDPFIVLPAFFFSADEGGSPAMGDYAAVLHKARIYPAIVGEAGPNYKTGEASLLLARAIDQAASGRRRPVSDLSVTYLAFPGTADPRGEPDLVRWEDRVRKLLAANGLSTDPVHLHSWLASQTPIPTPPQPQ